MPSDEREPPFRADDPAARPPAAGTHVPVVLRMHRALAALDEAAPRTLGVCRAAAFRYLEALQQQGVGPAGALRLLRTAAAAWTPADRTVAERMRLDRRLHYWVGTVYRLRWGVTPGEPAPPGPHL